MLPKFMNKVNYQLPQNDRIYTACYDGTCCWVESSPHNPLVARIEYADDAMKFVIEPFELHEQLDRMLAIALEYMFSHFKWLKKIVVIGAQDFAGYSAFTNLEFQNPKEMIFTRETFYQLPAVWHRSGFYRPFVESWVNFNERMHPVRPAHICATYYRRYFPEIQKTLSFRMLDIKSDLERFYEWHNQKRVYDFWELNKSREELRAYLEKGVQDHHQIPMILEIDAEPAGYFEIYWAAEDRIAPYYEYEPYDRGVHMLIGEKKFLGVENTTAVFRAVLHFMYLDDVRTRRVVAEPRSDNEKFIKYTQIIPSWNFVKEFDFPHKRAALIMSKREQFFMKGAL